MTIDILQHDEKCENAQSLDDLCIFCIKDYNDWAEEADNRAIGLELK